MAKNASGKTSSVMLSIELNYQLCSTVIATAISTCSNCAIHRTDATVSRLYLRTQQNSSSHYSRFINKPLLLFSKTSVRLWGPNRLLFNGHLLHSRR